MRGKRFIFFFLLSFFIFLVYLHNLSRSVYGGDVGDLITAAYLGGVAHPPGYPLFTLLGFILTRIHGFPSPAFAVGLISAISGAMGIGLFYLTISELTDDFVICLLSSLTLAFSYFYWFYSEIAEVFALNSFFLITILYLSIKFLKKQSKKAFFILFFMFGISFTNHQTIALTFPAVFILILAGFIKSKSKISLAITGFLGIITGLGIYIYIPLASLHNPIVNWDHVNNFSSFLQLVLRRDYGTFSSGLFAPPNFTQRLISVKTYLQQVLFQLTIPVITLSVLGFIFLLKNKKIFALCLLLGFILSGPAFIFYAGFPLTGNFYFGVNERFFVESTIFILFSLPFGIILLSNLFKNISRVPVIIFQSVFFIIPFMLFMYNFPKTDLSKVFVGDNYGKDILSSLPKNSHLFLAGDTIIFNTWYMHYVMGMRPDVEVLNINGNVGSPYYNVLEKIFLSTHPNASGFKLQSGIVEEFPQINNVFSVEELQPVSGSKFTWIPYGLTLKLVPSKDQIPENQYSKQISEVWKKMHIPSIASKNIALHNFTISDIPNSYANAMLITGNYYLSNYKDFRVAKSWYDKALTVTKDYDKTYSSLGVYYLAIGKSCYSARDSFEKAIFLNPIERLNFLLLYVTYKNCIHDNQKANSVKKAFEKEFKMPFDKTLSKVNNKL